MTETPPPLTPSPAGDAPIKPEGFDGYVAMARSGGCLLVCRDHGIVGAFATAWDDDYLEAVEEHADTMHATPGEYDLDANLERLGLGDPSDATPAELPPLASGPLTDEQRQSSNALPHHLRAEAAYTRAMSRGEQAEHRIADALLRLANRIEATR